MFTRERLTRWTDALRKFPEKQGTGALNPSPDKFCCLGMLCEVEGIKKEETLEDMSPYYYYFPNKDKNLDKASAGLLEGKLAAEFGGRSGCFCQLKMPALSYQGEKYASLVAANDGGVPWSVIADHLDKHYPCSDEGEQA